MPSRKLFGALCRKGSVVKPLAPVSSRSPRRKPSRLSEAGNRPPVPKSRLKPWPSRLPSCHEQGANIAIACASFNGFQKPFMANTYSG